MAFNYLMYSASVLYFICYLPELYANYKNKNANIYNVPEKFIMLIATILAFSYAIINNNTELITNYGPILLLDSLALGMRCYYAYYNKSLVIIGSSSENNNHDIVLFLKDTSLELDNIIDTFSIKIEE